MRQKHVEENSYSKFTELDVEFVKKYWCYGNLDILAKVLKRTRYSLNNMTQSRGLHYNQGQKTLTYDELCEIYKKSYYKLTNPMIATLEHEAIKEAHEAVKETPIKEVSKPLCPCNVDDTIIVKRIKLVNDGELWVCARCGRQIGCKKGDF